MAHQQGPQAAWYICQSGHELEQSVNVAYTPSTEHRAGYCRFLESKQTLAWEQALVTSCRHPERFACSRCDCSSRTKPCILSGGYEIHHSNQNRGEKTGYFPTKKQSPSPARILMRRLSRRRGERRVNRAWLCSSIWHGSQWRLGIITIWVLHCCTCT